MRKVRLDPELYEYIQNENLETELFGEIYEMAERAKSYASLGEDVAFLLKEVEVNLEEARREANECTHCHGSGGGYMGGTEPICTYCNGTGNQGGSNEI